MNQNQFNYAVFAGSLIRFVLILFMLVSCSDISETVTFDPDTQSTPGEDLSTLYPTIQTVYPGTLQSLDIPESYPSDVIPDGARFAVVFSEEMENDAGEMDSAFGLYQNGVQIGHSVEQSASSRYFTVVPVSGNFQYGNIYDLYIYQFAYLNDDSSLYLNFEPLVDSPATTLSPVNPEYVVYRFQTASSPTEDNEPPVFLAATPGPGDTNVDDLLSSTSGTIVVTLFDNSNPMIFTDTVNTSSVELYLVGTGAVALTVTVETNDLNLKTYYLTPPLPLAASSTYRVTLSVGNRIEDIAGNSMAETTYFFQTL
jgi:hypothetical protein